MVKIKYFKGRDKTRTLFFWTWDQERMYKWNQNNLNVYSFWALIFPCYLPKLSNEVTQQMSIYNTNLLFISNCPRNCQFFSLLFYSVLSPKEFWASPKCVPVIFTHDSSNGYFILSLSSLYISSSMTHCSMLFFKSQ